MKVGIIGSTHAGVFAAKSIKGEHPDYDVTVFEKNDTVSFLSCGIALWVGNNVNDPQNMFYESPESLVQQGIDMKMRHEVTVADLATKTLTYKNVISGEETTEQFDKLVVATGSAAVIPDLPGLDSDKVYYAKNWDDANRLKEIANDVKRVVVIGAGYIGAEIAEQFALSNKEVVLVDGADRVLANNFTAEFTDRIEAKYQEHGVRLELDQFITGFEDTDNGIIVKTTKGEYEADIAVLGIGFRPNTTLFEGQVDMLKNGAIITDKYMESSVPGVFAAGDASTIFYNPTQANDYIPLATNAVRQGLLVGKNIDGKNVAYMGTQSTSAVELFETAMAVTGLNPVTAAKRGIEVEQTVIEENYRAEFMLTNEKVLVGLTWDKQSRKVLGAAFMSRHDITQAANVVSLAIQAGMTVDELAFADFFFQPNFDQPVNYIGAVAMAAAAN